MNREQKAAVIEEIAAQISESEAVFAVDYRGISVPEAAELRTRLRDADASFRVVKNTLTERAADKAGAARLKELLEGPTAFTFVRGDAALAAKALADLGRATDTLAFKGGVMGGEPLTAEQIASIARLPAREVLHGQLVGMIAAPLTGLVRGLNALIAGVAIQLRQIADQGLVSGEAPAEAEPEPETPAEPEAAAEPDEAEAPAPADEEAPTPEEEVASPVDEAPAEAAPDPPPAEEAGAPDTSEPQPDQAEGEDPDSENE